ncbi:hypothetical protein RGQ15_21535 [Paracoccus sp. MBLB3053]|uniref:Phage baseplate protein n=1 Tax=Paracoccus aurantius TaxID=3073814 RepID=A0ABU2HZV2_9RHOB|nr:hypothetical protein [Paracoccus sp. MBLB3053]MDS9470139.1 hypothetical protein [Paracoccus sp. MBLB3053]
MLSLSDNARLALWERAALEHPLDRALTILAVTQGEERDSLSALSLGERDRRLYAVAGMLFGPRIVLEARCALCAELTDVSFSVDEVLALPAADDAPYLTFRGGKIHYRLPDSRDMAAALSAGDRGREILLARLSGGLDDSDVLAAVEADLARRAGVEAMTLSWTCAACGATASNAFDILDYLWRRLGGQAERLLRDIHVIASAYGWTTAEILNLSETRRAAHVAMIAP